MSSRNVTDIRLTAVTGGIGSGKSVVCRILETLGRHVYDCDARAKALMDADAGIKHAIACQVCDEAICNGQIDRAKLAEVVFNDAGKLVALNAIVHESVRRDLCNWAKSHPDGFVETAILYESGLDRMVDEEWVVDAPESVRIERVMARNCISEDEVRQRIKSQSVALPEPTCGRRSIIVNDGIHAVLPQVSQLLEQHDATLGK